MRRASLGQESRRNPFLKLRYFCYAAQAGSISKAAERAGLSQPSVSLQIQGLEKELKTALFQRRGPKIVLTSDGQALYELAWPLVEALDTLPNTFHMSRRGLETSHLNIAAGEATILYILPDFIKEYVRLYPGVSLRLHNVNGPDGLKLLRNDAVDLVVGSMIEVPSDIIYMPTFQYDPMLIMAVDHPLAQRSRIALKDVAAYPLILPPQHRTTWKMVDFVFQKHGLNYGVLLESGGWEVIKKYVELGLGLSIVIGVCLNGQEKLVARPLNKYFPRRSYGIVVKKGKLPSVAATRFIDLMKERARPCSCAD